MANQQPVFILPQGTDRFKGKDAQRLNIMAGKILSGIVRTTLGPKGMDKMLVDQKLGDVIVTNDGVTILREMDIAHPAARMLVEIAKKQEDNVGDGTTTAVIIAGELLAQAEKLLDDGVPAPVVINGYRLALAKTMEVLPEIAIDAKDEETLMKVAITAMTGKGSDAAREPLADLLVKAVMRVEEDGKVNKDSINIQRISGESIEQSQFVDGIFIDKAPVSKLMPKDVKDAKIALLKYPLEIKSLTTDAKIDLIDPSHMQAFLDNEEEMIKDLVNKVIDSGANVLFCQKGIDDMAELLLRKAGIMTFKRVKNTDMRRLEKATGAKTLLNVDALTENDLGYAGHVYVEKVFDHELTFIKECRDPKASSIIVRGSTRHVTEEIKRALDDALGVVAATLEDGQVVIGGGAPEVELSKQLRAYAETISGKEQLSIKAFAEALEIVPRTLAENAGLNTVDIMVDLRAAHSKSKTMGLNVFEGKVMDMAEIGVVEPLRVKKLAIQSASEATEMILRIDDLVASKGGLNSTGNEDDGLDHSGMPPAPMGGMGGMGGMPPMM